MDFPHSDDPLVRALQRLVAKEGGWAQVAGTELSDQTIYQIAMCKHDSKTGKAKGVGPRVRRYLDSAFPDWLSAAAEPPKPTAASATLRVFADTLAQILLRLNEKDRDRAQRLLASLAQAPDSAIAKQRLVDLMEKAHEPAPPTPPLGAPVAPEHQDAMESLARQAELTDAASHQRRRASSR